MMSYRGKEGAKISMRMSMVRVKGKRVRVKGKRVRVRVRRMMKSSKIMMNSLTNSTWIKPVGG
jgi:hypothetical protein